MFYEAFLGGIWASFGSTLGKLSGNNSIVGDSIFIWAGLMMSMILANTWGCRHYLRALDGAANSFAPTVISAASTYLLSGLIGILVFGEASSLQWWLGTLFIVLGLALVANQKEKDKAD